MTNENSHYKFPTNICLHIAFIRCQLSSMKHIMSSWMDDEKFLKPQQAIHKIKYADAIPVSRPTQDHCLSHPRVLFCNIIIKEKIVG